MNYPARNLKRSYKRMETDKELLERYKSAGCGQNYLPYGSDLETACSVFGIQRRIIEVFE